MNVTAVHTGIALPLIRNGRYRQVVRIVSMSLWSYEPDPVGLSTLVVAIRPLLVRHSLNDPISRPLPDAAIALLVERSGMIAFSPATRIASSTFGATFR